MRNPPPRPLRRRWRRRLLLLLLLITVLLFILTIGRCLRIFSCRTRSSAAAPHQTTFSWTLLIA